MLQRSTIQLLRFHFSFFLLPIFLFAISQVQLINYDKALLIFFILHFLVYPASNGYNSYMDKDDTPIGALKKPLQPTIQLYYVSLLLNALAIIAAYFIHPVFMLGIIIYILASSAYSWRSIRLKKYPITGFLTVFIFQGALVFYITYIGCSQMLSTDVPWLQLIISSCLIGALYPLTQVYQHEADKKDGVMTISMLLGKRGSFIFSGFLFSVATVLLYFIFGKSNDIRLFYYFIAAMLPVVLFYLYWMRLVWLNECAANFKYSLRMNIIATISTSIFFIYLILQNH